MAEFEKVIKEYKRMCKSYANCSDGCPFRNTTCKYELIEWPDEAEKIIMRWSAENPVKTNRKKFEEVFGFDILKRFSFSEHDKEWFNKEYKEGDNHDE